MRENLKLDLSINQIARELELNLEGNELTIKRLYNDKNVNEEKEDVINTGSIKCINVALVNPDVNTDGCNMVLLIVLIILFWPAAFIYYFTLPKTSTSQRKIHLSLITKSGVEIVREDISSNDFAIEMVFNDVLDFVYTLRERLDSEEVENSLFSVSSEDTTKIVTK